MRSLWVVFFFFLLLCSCRKEKYEVYYDDVKSIPIADGITVDNGAVIRDKDFNHLSYENFLKYLVASNRFLIVPLKDFDKTNSTDKIVITLRHDIDDNINSAIKFAYREHKYGVKASYFALHTALYYGITRNEYFKRHDQVIFYLKKIQDGFEHEVGFHNDLITLQVVYNIEPREFLKNELAWLRSYGINVYGTVSHGSSYCYKYHYVNSYFWEGFSSDNGSFFYNWESVPKDGKVIILPKEKLSDYNLRYEGNNFHPDYFFADSNFPNGKRWNMKMVDWDTIKPGKKIIILLHPQHWD
jgi:hypothetical protein